jgi:hypothetical protein
VKGDTSEMKKIVPHIAIILALLVLPGCFQVDTVIKVNQDGSGTVEETMLVSKKLLAQMNEMMQGFAGQAGNKGKNKVQPLDIYDPAKLKAKAAEMGSGVTYTSGKKVTTDKFMGYRAVYAFTDINKLLLNQNRSKDLTAAPATIDDGSSKKREPVMFRFSKGSPATLTIRQPEDTSTGKTSKEEKHEVQAVEDKNRTGADAEQFREMVEGLKFSLTVEVRGNIVQTNATYHEGSRITVMELDFDKLLGNPEQIARLNRLQPKSFEDVRELARNIPGMKVDLNKELTVTFE